jgi:hypothetical protein
VLMVSAILPGGEDLGSKPMSWNKTFAQNISDEKHANLLKFKWISFKFQRKIVLKSKFQNKIIIQQWDSNLEKV